MVVVNRRGIGKDGWVDGALGCGMAVCLIQSTGFGEGQIVRLF